MKILAIFFILSNSFASINEDKFNSIAHEVMQSMQEEIKLSGLSIKLNLDWDSPVVNAGANRDGTRGTINLHGGYAKLAPVTSRSFTHTLCHELGHLIGGGVKVMPTAKYSSEAESDYFATKTCLKKVFKDNNSFSELSKIQKEWCKSSFEVTEELNLCAEILLASRDQLNVENFLTPSLAHKNFEELDQSINSTTNHNGYPTISCRYTTYIHGALNWKRPSCWFNEDTSLKETKYISNYRYYEAMFIGTVKSKKKTVSGCKFEIINFDYFIGSYLDPLTEDEVQGYSIYKYGKCSFNKGDNLSGTLTLFKDELYYNVDSKDK